MSAHAQLSEFIHRHRRLFVLTGAGCSTGSGLPDYRDAGGNWKRPQPVTYQAFMADPPTRRRYWARSLVGWRHVGAARPNGAHRALARLEASGQSEVLVTQNVDRLHQAAGSVGVIDLHGRLDVVRCTGCGHELPRAEVQRELEHLNPAWVALEAAQAPDGDADLEEMGTATFQVPACPRCGGIIKPDVVFFGEGVPAERAACVARHLARADAVLVVGSSLMVRSGFRLVQAAAAAGKPVAAVNLGLTRADDLLSLKVVQPCEEALSFLL
jgi:NAD-dependent SIR2 family protein deacetylase